MGSGKGIIGVKVLFKFTVLYLIPTLLTQLSRLYYEVHTLFILYHSL